MKQQDSEQEAAGNCNHRGIQPKAEERESSKTTSGCTWREVRAGWSETRTRNIVVRRPEGHYMTGHSREERSGGHPKFTPAEHAWPKPAASATWNCDGLCKGRDSQGKERLGFICKYLTVWGQFSGCSGLVTAVQLIPE